MASELEHLIKKVDEVSETCDRIENSLNGPEGLFVDVDRNTQRLNTYGKVIWRTISGVIIALIGGTATYFGWRH